MGELFLQTPLEALLPNEVNPRLYAIEAGDQTLSLKENELELSRLVELSEDLKTAPETAMGSTAVKSVLEKSGFRAFILPYRLFFPPEAFKAYLGMYSQFDSKLKDRPVPAEDVYVVMNNDKTPFAFVQRSSLWSAVVDGVTTAREYKELMRSGEIINVGGIQPCFRREVKETVSGWRQLGFTQADIELAALIDGEITPQYLDTQSVCQMIDNLSEMGIPKEMIQIRVNNFMDIVYTILGDNLSFLEKENFGWRYLDRMATARVEKDSLNYEEVKKETLTIIATLEEQDKLPAEAIRFLRQMVNEGEYDESVLQTYYPDAYQVLSDLEILVSEIENKYPQITVYIDPLSIRGGTPGYDRTTVQADIVTPQKIYPEVAGGGAYQQAAKLSWRILFEEEPPENFYMVGFALGLLRIKTTLEFIQ